MAIFLISALKDSEPLAEAISQCKDIEALEIKAGDWLVSYKGTSIQLSRLLDIPSGKNGSAVVVAVSSYYGRAPTSIWEWLKTNWEGEHGS